MTNQFDVDTYVKKWDSIILPIMIVFIVSSVVGVVAMNKLSTPDCKRHEYVFCGTTDNHASDH